MSLRLDRPKCRHSSAPMTRRPRGGLPGRNAMRSPPNPVVHLELHTGDLAGARAFYEDLCGWRSQRIETGAGSYLALGLGERLGGGMVSCPTERPGWVAHLGGPGGQQ